MRGRHYDPETQQFLSRDPLEALSGQPYVYANRNPVNYVDPDGAWAVRLFGQTKDKGDKGGMPSTGAGGSGTRSGPVGSRSGGSQEAVQASTGKITSRQARRSVMRSLRVPTSSQPVWKTRTEEGYYYEYEVPTAGGGVRRVSVNHHKADPSHPRPHWEAGITKPGSVNRYGVPRYYQYDPLKPSIEKAKQEYDIP